MEQWIVNAEMRQPKSEKGVQRSAGVDAIQGFTHYARQIKDAPPCR